MHSPFENVERPASVLSRLSDPHGRRGQRYKLLSCIHFFFHPGTKTHRLRNKDVIASFQSLEHEVESDSLG